MQQTLSTLVTPAVIVRLVLGWGAFAALLAMGDLLAPPVPSAVLITALAAIVAVILICSFGVVHEAERLAHRLGDPYGTLVLTLSIVLIEVVLIAAVLLGPGENPFIARDSVIAVSMIILNAVIGLSLLVGGIKHGSLRPNRTGMSTYLAVLVVMLAVSFAVPALIGEGGEFTVGQEIPIIVLTLAMYAFFIWQQMTSRADDFREIQVLEGPPRGHTDGTANKPGAAAPGSAQGHTHAATEAAPSPSIGEVFAEHKQELIIRFVLLVLMVLPIVLLSHDMASLLDDGLGRVGAPVALSGIVIAVIVFLPESITSVRAALQGEMQRVGNLCHGALVSTVGLTIPVVLLIGMITGKSVVLAASPIDLMLLGVTLLLSVATFLSQRVTATHGFIHLVLFAVYGIAVFA